MAFAAIGQFMKRGLKRHALVLGCMAAVAVFSASCGGKVEGDTDYVFFDFVAPGGTTGAFAFESTTETERDVSSEHASLRAMTIETTTPGQNLAWLADIEGIAKKGDQPRFASQTKIGPVTKIALDIHFHGDIQPYFADGHHVVVHWNGHVNGVVPAGGVAIQCRVGLKF